ncbi:hypothetical protein BDU57DRAFT_518249, partial [Ampelomyces quisqualis]
MLRNSIIGGPEHQHPSPIHGTTRQRVRSIRPREQPTPRNAVMFKSLRSPTNVTQAYTM